MADLRIAYCVAGLEEVADAEVEADFVVISERRVLDGAISYVVASEAVVRTGNGGELNVAVVADVARDASTYEGVEGGAALPNGVEVVGDRNEVRDIFAIVEVEVGSDFGADGNVVGDGELTVDREAVVAAADADVVVVRCFGSADGLSLSTERGC